jgi:hypothetical protein
MHLLTEERARMTSELKRVSIDSSAAVLIEHGRTQLVLPKGLLKNLNCIY